MIISHIKHARGGTYFFVFISSHFIFSGYYQTGFQKWGLLGTEIFLKTEGLKFILKSTKIKVLRAGLALGAKEKGSFGPFKSIKY